ncbi:MAG: RimK family alpha-L-glutamate ligase [Vallitaleaceae bacterium]|nr:RimK family alpha-L-glutamate ligase [Vallitaleaceae bacterium]
MSVKGWIIYKVPENELNETHYETKRFIEEAKLMDIELEIYSPNQIEIIVTREDKRSIFVNGQVVDLPDFVLPRMGSGTTYFALALIRHLERLGVPCINTSLSIETVRDKLYSHQILAEKNLPVPKTMLMKFPIDIELIKRHFTFPIVIKTLSGSLGKGVFQAKNEESFMNLARIIEIANPNINIILQEMVTDSHGKDLRVFVVGGRVIGCMKRESSSDDFRANYSAGGTVAPYELTHAIEWLALEATKVLGLDISGVDLLFDGDQFKICEVNSSPMFKGMESCLEVNVPSEIFQYVMTRFQWGH